MNSQSLQNVVILLLTFTNTKQHVFAASSVVASEQLDFKSLAFLSTLAQRSHMSPFSHLKTYRPQSALSCISVKQCKILAFSPTASSAKSPFLLAPALTSRVTYSPARTVGMQLLSWPILVSCYGTVAVSALSRWRVGMGCLGKRALAGR